MKDPQAAHEKWTSLYAKEVDGIKKFRRKSREPVKHVRRIKSDLGGEPGADRRVLMMGRRTEEPAAGGLRERAAPPPAADRVLYLRDANAALDMTIRAFAASGASPEPSAAEPALGGALQLGGREQARSSEPRPQPRIVLCPRSAHGAFASASRAPHVSHAERAASPRRRPSETSGVVTEIKAVQQTRRLLANARERTRVHTISAAFEALRKQVPCYSYGQKLSKLAILRIACNYILSLAQLADMDYTPDQSNMSFTECVEQCTRTLQAEGRSKKRKE
ncbi:transcription factor atoh8 [Scleropages formosus]|uniref:transcription factor atoh8 n=1 Tax=Scleropages formosus TaxID=113540 RepID=UPI0010FA984B|nr:protein atonal homolog 8 [Scleropages formosus]